MPKEESFPIPMKYIDVTRTAHTSLDVLLEKQIDDYWNVDGERELSDAWTGFTRFMLLNERPPNGYAWSGVGDLRGNKQPQDPTMYGRICGSICLMQRKAKQNKSGLSRNRSSIIPDNYVVSSSVNLRMKNSDTLSKNARRKLEVPMPAAMPCKTLINSRGETCRSIGKSKTKYACFVDADFCTRPRLEGAGHKPHQDHITAKGMNPLNHYSLVHEFIPMPQALKIPKAKTAVETVWEKLEKIPAWQLTKVRNKKEVIAEARTKVRKVHFASLMDLCHLKNSELEPQYHKYKGRVVLRGDIVKMILVRMQYSLNKDLQHHK